MPDLSVRLSVLDLSPIVRGGTAAESFANTLDLSRHAENWGYHRYWMAEHHNIPGVASAATAILIGHVASGTSRIRVGAGGIMLPNHAPLVIAEQFGTLESLYPGRIDLGLGRAPGGDMATTMALRRDSARHADNFPTDVQELLTYLGPTHSGQVVRAIPGEGTNVPVYLLGSSHFSATLASQLGLPFAFASHFAPDHLLTALEIYRSNYQPSERWPQPYVMVGVNVVAADTDTAARRLFTSVQQQFIGMLRRTPGELPPPVDDIDALWSPAEKAHVNHMTRYSAVGAPTTVRDALQGIIDQTQADEIIATSQIYDHAARRRSFELLAQTMGLPTS